jgi:hypothetical protein
MCHVLHQVLTAKNGGIHLKMVASYDYADRLANVVEMKLKDGERMRTLDKLFNSDKKSIEEINEVDMPSLSQR